MAVIATFLTALVMAEHVYILVLEMFLWTTKRARRIFGTTADFAEQTKVLAANQGLYNGFLAAGLAYGLIADGAVGFAFTVFFLLCVIIAGIYGGLTANRRILLVQAGPALLALLFVLLAG